MNRSGEGFAPSSDGTRIFYESAGEGDAVVLCDGIACDGFIWKYLRPELLPHYRVIHWNYRGHGRSGAPADASRVGVDDHARDLHAVLGALGVKRAALISHSMGTQVSLEAYRQRPEAIAGMALMCGSYGHITRTFHGTDVMLYAIPWAQAMLERYPGVMRALWSRSPAKLAAMVAKVLGEVDALRIQTEDLLPYFDHFTHLDPGMFFRMLTAAGVHTAEDILTSVEAPTLVVAAERDTFTPVRYAEQMARQIPGAELLFVARGSHTAPIEQPEVINPKVMDFLARRVRWEPSRG